MPSTLTNPIDLVFQVNYSNGLKTATDTVTVSVAPVPTASANAPLIIAGATQQVPLLVVAPPAAEVPEQTTQQLAAQASGGDGHYTWLWKYKGQAGGPSPDPTLGATNGQVLVVDLLHVTAPTTYAFEVTLTDGAAIPPRTPPRCSSLPARRRRPWPCTRRRSPSTKVPSR